MTVLFICLGAAFGLLSAVYLLHLIGLVVRGVGMTLGFVALRVFWVIVFAAVGWAFLREAGVL